MPSYTLEYFDGCALGEVSRQLFVLAEKPYTDKRISFAEWPTHKTKTPFGKMPVLFIDGKELPQSFAIARYLAREFGYAGNTAFEQAWVDALGDQFKDYWDAFHAFFVIIGNIYPGDKEKVQKESGEPARDAFFPLIEKQLSKSTSGFIVGSTVTWIDLVIADHAHFLTEVLPGFLDKYPKVLEHIKKIHAIPQIKKWVESRPARKF